MDLMQTLCLSIVAYLTLMDGADTLDFARHVFSDLGDSHGNITQTALKNQAEFDALAPEARQVLLGLFQMRVRDLQTTLEHTLAMQEVVGLLTENSALESR